MQLPRVPEEITQSILARLVSTSALTDVSEGGVTHSLVRAFAEELATGDKRVYDLHTFWMFNARGEDLDLVLSLLPVRPRAAAQYASGGTFTIRRFQALTELSIPAGTLMATSAALPGVYFTNMQPIVCPIGVLDVTDSEGDPIHFKATLAGPNVRAIAGAVNQLQAQYQDVYGLINTTSIAGGTDAESDESCQSRLKAWVQGLGACQPSAIEAMVDKFQSSDGVYAVHRRVVEYPTVPGYSEVVVDDGSGFQGYIRSANATSGEVPAVPGGGRRTFWFESPAATHPKFSRTRLGATLSWQTPMSGLLTRLEDGKAITVTPGFDVEDGDTWSMYGHKVYTGYLAELQAYLRAYSYHTGTRVRVIPPELQQITLSARIRVAAGYNINTIKTALRLVIQDYFRALAPGEPLIMHELHDYIGSPAQGPELVPGLLNIVFDQTDIYPGSERAKLWADDPNILLRT